jgi:2-iminoacetate synthase ThiH
MYFRMSAVSRLDLDNFAHFRPSWFSEGKRARQIALRFGAKPWLIMHPLRPMAVGPSSAVARAAAEWRYATSTKGNV